MSGYSEIGKLLIILGIVIVFVGIFINFMPKIPYSGKLPGDIHIKKKNFIFYFPLTTSIIVSILVSKILTVTFLIIRFFQNRNLFLLIKGFFTMLGFCPEQREGMTR